MAKLRESMRSRVMYNRDLQKKALEDIQKITGWPDYLYRYSNFMFITLGYYIASQDFCKEKLFFSILSRIQYYKHAPVGSVIQKGEVNDKW